MTLFNIDDEQPKKDSVYYSIYISKVVYKDMKNNIQLIGDLDDYVEKMDNGYIINIPQGKIINIIDSFKSLKKGKPYTAKIKTGLSQIIV